MRFFKLLYSIELRSTFYCALWHGEIRTLPCGDHDHTGYYGPSRAELSYSFLEVFSLTEKGSYCHILYPILDSIQRYVDTLDTEKGCSSSECCTLRLTPQGEAGGQDFRCFHAPSRGSKTTI